ncbi:DUF3107 domain-containing protein [Brevibacterium album]|uniref:DUF3107 domain-containing protein n=1 Tax=Brevibacterium album TaxID=417948 RepID=UPI0004128433|nr:DUF3107 domain-containing protein [Brevibacterium album]
MEIKIGMRQSNREIVLDSDRTRDEIGELVAAALAEGTVLSLDDSKGRRVLVPADALAYVELGEEQARRVGFGVV